VTACLSGQTSMSVDYNGTDFNDSMNSWICGAGVRYEFCDNPANEDDCRSQKAVTGAGAAYNSDTGHANKLTLLKMYEYDAVNDTGAATVYIDPDCTSGSAYFLAGDPGQAVGYTKSDIIYWNSENDKVSGVRVPVGYTLTIYHDDGFTGNTDVFEGMEDDDGYMVCQRCSSVCDQMTSLVMRKNDVPASAKGSWIQVGAGQASYDFAWGFVSTDASTATATQQATLA